MSSFSRNSVTKLLIVNLEGGGEVTAYFNPKEIQIDKTVPWQKHKDSKADEPFLEFTGAEGRQLSMELPCSTRSRKRARRSTVRSPI